MRQQPRRHATGEITSDLLDLRPPMTSLLHPHSVAAAGFLAASAQ
ncbi:MAG: hypothetical protein ACO3C1_03650 [Ilumatobacteraceae bacterium]